MLHDKIVIVIEVYIRKSMLKNKNPKLLRTFAPSLPIS